MKDPEAVFSEQQDPRALLTEDSLKNYTHTHTHTRTLERMWPPLSLY